MRILHLLVIGVLVFAAAYVYRIKMESTVRTERVLRLHADIREQRDAIAALRAEWTRLDAPLRLQGLVERHLPLKPINATQYDSLKNLPERPARLPRARPPTALTSPVRCPRHRPHLPLTPRRRRRIHNDRSRAHRR